jgi:hypothetical protein
MYQSKCCVSTAKANNLLNYCDNFGEDEASGLVAPPEPPSLPTEQDESRTVGQQIAWDSEASARHVR